MFSKIRNKKTNKVRDKYEDILLIIIINKETITFIQYNDLKQSITLSSIWMIIYLYINNKNI